jgi:nucleotide-binding universal stress UspA family protein
MCYRTIIAVINEHSGSTVTARYALALAASCKARLVLYAAHTENTSEAILHHTERHQEHLFTAALGHDISVTRITEVGLITRLLPKRVLAEEADLVFYPLLPGECYGATLQQQTVHTLLRSIMADLAIMRIMHMGKPHPRHILVPLGGATSDQKQRVAFLTALGTCFHAQITLFHRSANKQPVFPEDFSTMRTALRHHHLHILERSANGPIAKAIALEAISHHHDLIVMGASERTILWRLLFGNPAGDLMRRPPCNVILFRAAPIRP